MRRTVRERIRAPRHSTVAAYAALFIALGGVAYAGLPRNSVKTWHIKNGHVRSADIKNGEVRSADIKNQHVRSADIKDNGVRGRDIRDGDVKPADLDLAALGDQLPVAKAYGYVNKDGTVDPARSMNLTSANVTSPSGGLYCFNGLPFDPKAVLATTETGDVQGGLGFASARVTPDNRAVDKCTGNEQASVVTTKEVGANADLPVFVVMY